LHKGAYDAVVAGFEVAGVFGAANPGCYCDLIKVA
jgi:hypothetical protein